MIHKMLTIVSGAIAYGYKLLVVNLDQLFSMRVPHIAAVNVYARRLALCKEHGTGIRYIGAPTRYNSARLLPLAMLCLTTAVVAMVGFVYWTITWQPLQMFTVLVVGMVISAMLFTALRDEYSRHVRRVFTITDTKLIWESPMDCSWVRLHCIDRLFVQHHTDDTATITYTTEHSSQDKSLGCQLRRIAAEETEDIVRLLQQRWGCSVEATDNRSLQ